MMNDQTIIEAQRSLNREPTPNGALQFALGGRDYAVYGGPFAAAFHESVPAALLVKLDPNADVFCDINFPIKDFSVPTVEAMRAVIERLLREMHANEIDAYVGCMAGRGRTGLFLACLVKTLGLDRDAGLRMLAGLDDPRDLDPAVRYVRLYYYQHAVENVRQEYFVRSFTPGFRLRATVLELRLRGRLRSLWRRLSTAWTY